MPEFFSFINEILWGSVMIYLLLGAGCWFTWRTGFIQFRYIRQFSRSLKGSLSPQPGGLTSFQALCTSLAARVAAVIWPAWRWLSPQAVRRGILDVGLGHHWHGDLLRRVFACPAL